MIEKSDTGLTVTLVRPRLEKVVAIIAGLIAIQAGILFAVDARTPPFTLTCDRAADTCTQVGRGTYTFPLSPLRRSEARPYESGELRWMLVDESGEERSLGAPSSTRAQREQYRSRAVELQQFLDDPGLASYQATYIAHSAGFGLLFAVVAPLALALTLLNAWRVTIHVDRSARTLTVRRLPGLFASARRVIPLAEVDRVEVTPGRIFLVFSVVQTINLRLRDASGKVLFHRRATAGKPGLELEAAGAALREVLPRAAA